MSFESVSKFENEIAEFYGAKHAVAVDCCTHAIELCLRLVAPPKVTFPSRTYISIPLLGAKLGIEWEWDNNMWADYYYIGNTNIIDAAVFWEEGGYVADSLMCLSFQYQKHLSLGKGGMILTDDSETAKMLRRLAYDGRLRDQPWRDQNISVAGYHYYMTPETAELGLSKLDEAKKEAPWQWLWLDWPDLRQMDVFSNE